MEGAVGTLYEGEHFQLLFKFSPKYPFDSPEVSLNVIYVFPCSMRLFAGMIDLYILLMYRVQY